MSPVLPPDEGNEEMVNSGMQIPKWLDEKVRTVAQRRGKSRNWVIRYALEWAMKQVEQEESARATVETAEPSTPKASKRAK